MAGPRFIGVDVGTSAVRACVIDEREGVLAEVRVALPPPRRDGVMLEQAPQVWCDAVQQALRRLAPALTNAPHVQLALDGTSGSVLVLDDAGQTLGPGLLYADARATTEAERIAAVAPGPGPALGAGSGLARALWLLARHPQARRVCTQADWLAGALLGVPAACDEQNALKLGYDPVARDWPDWLAFLGVADLLPKVVPAGTTLGWLPEATVRDLGWSAPTRLLAGTTDSTAAVLAVEPLDTDTGITVLGSTLVVKRLWRTRVEAAELGVYSHRLGRFWLPGGASNAGGTVLSSFFSGAELVALSRRIDPEQDSGLDYYPLPAVGERFPVRDPAMQPRLTPRPDAPERFLHGLLESLARIERAGYRRLEALGVPYPRRVVTLGGGAANPVWTRLRRRILGIPVESCTHEPCWGTARLARRGADWLERATP